MKRAHAVLLGLLLAGTLFGLTRATWIQATAPDLAGGTLDVAVSGAAAAPAVVALSLVALSAALATALSGRLVRFVTGPVMVAAGIGAILAVLDLRRDPVGASRSAIAEATGMVGAGSTAEPTMLSLLPLVPAVLLVLLGALVLLIGGRWRQRTRFRREEEAGAAPSGASPRADAPTVDPGEDPAGTWDALSRGEDPTHDDIEDTRSDGAPRDTAR
ncbi:MAG: Trp biosynthesis-associated membrane protein [Brachybacterium sp.]|nr:Trp biosynthesis-associated membrane protein [Brachybacterium sp.]